MMSRGWHCTISVLPRLSACRVPAIPQSKLGDLHDATAENAFTYDEMLDDIMLYWLPDAGASFARLCWEAPSAMADLPTQPISVPTEIRATFRGLRA